MDIPGRPDVRWVLMSDKGYFCTSKKKLKRVTKQISQEEADKLSTKQISQEDADKLTNVSLYKEFKKRKEKKMHK